MIPARVVYCADFLDPADAFDLAYLIRSDRHDLVAVVAPSFSTPVLDALETAAETSLVRREALDAAFPDGEPASVVAVSHFGAAEAWLRSDPAGFRSAVSRLFLVGGHANDYAGPSERVPIDPRLKERHPERFAPTGDPRLADPAAFLRLLVSGEAVIWLPRDVCLWRYAAPQILEIDPNPLTRWLIEHAATFLGPEAPVLLSSAPAFCLAALPEPMPWLRLFRAQPARATCEGRSGIEVDPGAATPNLHLVTAIDGFALGKQVTGVLRGAR